MNTERKNEWLNPELQEIEANEKINGYWFVHMKAANNRYMRFLPYIAEAFPETAPKRGLMESPLTEISGVKEALQAAGADIRGNVFLKNDAALPVYGSTWARGGMNAVLQIAERTAQKAKMLNPTEKYGKVNSDEFRELFARYTICVEKADDFGRSALRMAEKLGFRTVTGKQDLCGEAGEKVLMGTGTDTEETFFINPMTSENVYFGISSAAMRVRSQIRKFDIEVDRKHPLFLYIPCENGMIPSAITFGLKQLCLNDVHCFFVEKAEDPGVQQWMIRQAEDDGEETENEAEMEAAEAVEVSEAEGVSSFACDLMKYLISGGFTADEAEREQYQKLLAGQSGLVLPAASCVGLKPLTELGCPGSSMEEYIRRHDLQDVMDQATHIIWVTGGTDDRENEVSEPAMGGHDGWN